MGFRLVPKAVSDIFMKNFRTEIADWLSGLYETTVGISNCVDRK